MAPPSLDHLDSAEQIIGKEPITKIDYIETKLDEPLKKRRHNNKQIKFYTTAEVLQHNKEDDCWLIIDGSVYDVTRWIPRHPGALFSKF